MKAKTGSLKRVKSGKIDKPLERLIKKKRAQITNIGTEDFLQEWKISTNPTEIQ